jgi:hypothetical protein
MVRRVFGRREVNDTRAISEVPHRGARRWVGLTTVRGARTALLRAVPSVTMWSRRFRKPHRRTVIGLGLFLTFLSKRSVRRTSGVKPLSEFVVPMPTFD